MTVSESTRLSIEQIAKEIAEEILHDEIFRQRLHEIVRRFALEREPNEDEPMDVVSMMNMMKRPRKSKTTELHDRISQTVSRLEELLFEQTDALSNVAFDLEALRTQLNGTKHGDDGE